MTDAVSEQAETFSAFVGTQRLAQGGWATVAAAARKAALEGATHIVVLSDVSGETRDFEAPLLPQKTMRGRPRLGVTAREVTLLPQHWDWLSQQPGGASAALRRLVEVARKAPGADLRTAQAAAHRAMTTLAGDLPGYEEALRSLYSGDTKMFLEILQEWPEDIASYFARVIANAPKTGI